MAKKAAWIKKWKPVSDIGKAAKRGNNIKGSQAYNDQSPLIGNPIVNTDVFLMKDRHLARQAMLWAAWRAEKVMGVDCSKFTAMIVPLGVRFQGKGYGFIISLPDWADLDETNVIVEEIKEAA